ncbi:MAG: helix-turn-helix domain-containing protein [Clostridiales bacterium]|nr:helix-turn-helix domain-containing protein [Clostridiales bacterium]
MIYNFDELNFNVMSVDEFYHTNGNFKVIGRAYSALSLRTEGEGRFVINGKRFISKPGDVLFIPNNIPYEVEYVNSKSIVFHFENCNYTEAENITISNFAPIKILFENAMKEWKTRFCINGTKSAVYNILQTIADEKTPQIGIEDKLFIDCVDYIKASFCSPTLSLKQVCKKFFLSEATLRRKFQKYYNVSFIQFLSRLRFDKAFSMLLEGSESVSAIAHACGFEDEKYFSRAIKKKFGVSPSSLMH